MVQRSAPESLRGRKLTVGVVFGSRSVEHEVSIVSALQTMDAMDPLRYAPVPLYITKAGRWLTGPDLRRVEAFRDQATLASRCQPVVLRPEPGGGLAIEERAALGLRRGRTIHLDVLFPIVHGTLGEDGTLQGLFELADVAYVGAGVLGSAVGMDKITMKAVFQANGLPVVRYVSLTRTRWDGERDAVLDEIQEKLAFPMYVKPANLGSSVGISRANDRESLASALDVAAAYDRRLLVEESVEGATEINCSVLGNDDPIVSVCEEPIRWQDAALLSYDQKYLGGGKSTPGSGMASAKRRIPAPISPEQTEAIQRLAVAAFKTVDCAGIARVDFLLDRSSGALYVNEINTMPGSLSFYLWEPSGIPFPKLVDRLVELARERQRDRRRNIRSYDSKLLEQFGRGAKGAKGAR